MKKKSIVIIKCLIFLIVSIFVLQRVSWAVVVTGTAKDSTDRRTSLFYAMPRNSIDVAFGGTSHIYCTLCPQQIYDETGITSASFATSSQSVENTYWMLKEACKRQELKVFVMDMSALAASVSPSVNKFRLHFTSGITNIPDFSINKVLDYMEIKKRNTGWSSEMTIYDAWGILEFKNDTDRKAVSFTEVLDTLCYPASQFKTFGFMAADTIYPMKKLNPPASEKWKDLTETSEYEYLCKIYELCEKKGISLILVQAPFDYDFDNQGIYDQAKQWADEHGVSVVDYFELLEDLKINLATDMRDDDHLNYLGAKKATAYFSKYLQENYELQDHRGDAKYSLWEKRDFPYETVEEEMKEKIKG